MASDARFFSPKMTPGLGNVSGGGLATGASLKMVTRLWGFERQVGKLVATLISPLTVSPVKHVGVWDLGSFCQ